MNKEQIKERNKEIVELYLNGSLSIVQIGRTYGISRQRVSTILLQNGVEPQAVRTMKNVNAKIVELTETINQLKDKYTKRSKKFKAILSKQRLEVLNLNNVVTYKTGQVKNLQARVKELEEKLKEKNI